MLTKSKILELVKTAELTEISLNYIGEILGDFKDDELIPIDKAKIISDILEAEANLNDSIAQL